MATFTSVANTDAPVRPLLLSKDDRTRFRMRRVEQSINRYVIDRHCPVNGWLPVYYDDQASTAFLELKSIARRSYGCVVCARCRRELQEYKLFASLYSSGVICEKCAQDRSFRGFIVAGTVLSALWILAGIAYALFGGARW